MIEPPIIIRFSPAKTEQAILLEMNDVTLFNIATILIVGGILLWLLWREDKGGGGT